MKNAPDHHDESDESDEDDVAGHLRMTDEQLSSGTTPSEAAAAAVEEKSKRSDPG